VAPPNIPTSRRYLEDNEIRSCLAPTRAKPKCNIARQKMPKFFSWEPPFVHINSTVGFYKDKSFVRLAFENFWQRREEEE
jgi:hypothetical protein